MRFDSGARYDAGHRFDESNGAGPARPCVAAFQKTASTDLAPHLGPILKTDWEQFTADWLGFCRQDQAAVAP